MDAVNREVQVEAEVASRENCARSRIDLDRIALQIFIWYASGEAFILEPDLPEVTRFADMGNDMKHMKALLVASPILVGALVAVGGLLCQSDAPQTEALSNRATVHLATRTGCTATSVATWIGGIGRGSPPSPPAHA